MSLCRNSVVFSTTSDGASRARTGDLLDAIRAKGGLPAEPRLARAVLACVCSPQFSQVGRPVSRWKSGVLSSGVDIGELFGLMESRELVFEETVVV
jgi:hypothetical protein